MLKQLSDVRVEDEEGNLSSEEKDEDDDEEEDFQEQENSTPVEVQKVGIHIDNVLLEMIQEA